MRPLWLACLLPSIALAGVGKVEIVEGKASRTPKGGPAVALVKGSAVEVGDTLRVEQGNLKLRLDDSSVIALGAGSELRLDQASFKGKRRTGVSLRLLLGKVWAKVAKAAGSAKFEVVTERAVAGVRGTAFRVDVLDASHQHPASCVCVFEGAVGVWAGLPAGAGDGGSPAVKTAPPAALSRAGWVPTYLQLGAGAQYVVSDDAHPGTRAGHGDELDRFVAEQGTPK